LFASKPVTIWPIRHADDLKIKMVIDVPENKPASCTPFEH
jgi:hypothetical protein